MKLPVTLLFDWEAAGNPFFYRIYHRIYGNLRFNEFLNCTHVQPDYSKETCMSCPGGRSNFQIINPKNEKSVLMSFWDRGMDVFAEGLGWEKYDIVKYIGGLGMYKSSEKILSDYRINHVPYQYPLGVADSDNMIENAIRAKLPKKDKAVFIGAIYGTREYLAKEFKKTGFIDVFSGIGGQEYFNTLSQYKIIISLNGNGEFCLRDLEGFGLGIPVVRSELKTQFHNKLTPGVHYLKGSEPCREAWHTYPGVNIKTIADQFIHAIDEGIKSDIDDIGLAGQIYYEEYANPNYIADLFLDLCDINELI